MLINVDRIRSNNDETLSVIDVDEVFTAFGLEDEYRAVKVAGETRIPAGRYRVALRDAGGMTERYREQFPDLHRGMLHILDVPGFEWIYFHIGNTEKHSAGCILVASRARVDAGARITIQASTEAYERFYRRVVDAAAAGTLEVEIRDHDRRQVRQGGV